MRKRVNKKILFLSAIIILLLIGYYLHYKNSSSHEQFKENSNIEEFSVYEENSGQNLEKDENENDINNNIEKENKEMIIVHITGEVRNWGVIELDIGSRVIDAVNKAGGFTENADTEKINLAYELSDGIKIYIPSKNETEENIITTPKYIVTDSGEDIIMGEKEMEENKKVLVNINQATQTELETLPGIGPSIALKIITYREENGKFLNIEDIKNVSGIGENKFKNIKELICV